MINQTTCQKVDKSEREEDFVESFLKILSADILR
jgi:hypothetical protein